MSQRAHYYAWAAVAAGGAIALSAGASWVCQSPIRFLACLCLAVLGSTFKIKLPGMESCITPSFIPFLYAVGTMSWQETVVLAFVSGIVQTVWRPKRTPQAVQVAFNGANLALAIGCGYVVSHVVAANQVIVELAIAVMVFEVLNTLSVSTVVCLATEASLAGVWRNCHLWTFPYHLSGAVIAAVWAQSETAISISITLLGAVMLYLFSEFYRELVARVTPAGA